MCGITGILNGGLNAPEKVKLMLDAQKHRGPNAQGVWFSSDFKCTLGHNRLSIIDLQDTANQPFISQDQRFSIVFNGEIYNYLELKKELSPFFKFRTASDTEVLLAAWQHWGKDALPRLIGMFAFAIWDNQSNTLFAARDRFGVKPFYYSTQNGQFCFASEIKAMWAAGIPKEKSMPVWAAYLTKGGYGLPNETFWKEIQQLPGGHYLEWNAGAFEIIKWYDFESIIKNKTALTGTITQLKEEWLDLAISSIKLRFRSDVPVGFNLSGGLDSSLLLGLVYQLYGAEQTIDAFHFYTGNTDYDELPWVRQMIDQTSFPLETALLSATDIPLLTEKIAWVQDEPFGGIPTIAYSQIFKKAREKGVIVLLDGQGIDESLAGYDYYQTGSGSVVQGVSTSPVRPECLDIEFASLAGNSKYPTPFGNALQDLQYRDLFFTKIPRALRFNDRVSMLYGTELREPFLDHRLVELGFSMPSTIKIHEGSGKWIARQIAKELLPAQVALAPKRPLQTPQREWLAGPLKDFATNAIEQFSNSALANKKEVMRAWATYLKGNQDNSFYIWQWINCTYYL